MTMTVVFALSVSINCVRTPCIRSWVRKVQAVSDADVAAWYQANQGRLIPGRHIGVGNRLNLSHPGADAGRPHAIYRYAQGKDDGHGHARPAPSESGDGEFEPLAGTGGRAGG